MKNHYEPSLSPEEAERRHQCRVEAGRKGGLVKCKKGFACNRALAAEAGSKGGRATHKTRWFSEHPELAKKWAAVGGKKSKRGKKNEA